MPIIPRHPPRTGPGGPSGAGTLRATMARLAPVGSALLLTACAGSSTSGLGTGSGVATEAEWQALSEVRPTPLDGAPRVTVSGVDFLGSYPWSSATRVSAELGIAELAVAGLLRRRDVHFVERRRFAAVADSERAGRRPARGQPAAGVSQSAEFSAMAVWIPMGTDSAAIEVRVSAQQTGDIAGATRVRVAPDADPVTLGRAFVDGILVVMRDLGQLPDWQDPLTPETGTSNARTSARVDAEALQNFLRGLAAEEAWSWEDARRGYQAAADDGSFYEAAAALARAARLKLGGTLAES